MGKSKIQWTDYTYNEWISCTAISEACKFCYAEKFATRYGFSEWGPTAKRNRVSESTRKNPYRWGRKAIKENTRFRVFCSSLSDVFDDHESIHKEWRDNIFKSMRETSGGLDWLLLSKRPNNFIKYLPSDWSDGYKNAWLGVTIENKRRADERISHLINTPAYVRYISVEPIFERFELPDYGINQIIIGGESGPISKIRELDLNVVRYMIDQSKEKGIKVFFKQTGSILAKKLKLKDGHGGDFDEYPPALDWLKIREIPDPHPSFQLFPPNPEDINEDLKLEL